MSHYVLGHAAVDKEFAAGVQLSQVLGAQPAVLYSGPVEFRIVIAAGEGGGLYPDLAALLVVQFLAVLVKNTYRDARERVSYAYDRAGIVFVEARGLIVYRGNGENFGKPVARGKGHWTAAGFQYLVDVPQRFRRAAFAAHDRESEETQVRTLALLDELIDLFNYFNPVPSGSHSNLRTDGEDVFGEKLGR